MGGLVVEAVNWGAVVQVAVVQRTTGGDDGGMKRRNPGFQMLVLRDFEVGVVRGWFVSGSCQPRDYPWVGC